jgi:cytochrome c556
VVLIGTRGLSRVPEEVPNTRPKPHLNDLTKTLEGRNCMIRPVIVTVAVALGVTAVVAQSDPIAERRNLMKAQGGAARTASQMLKGAEAYDPAKAKQIYDTFLTTTSKFATLFPDTSKTGGETTASPKLWADKAGFETAIKKFDADVKAAQTQTASLDAFKTGFGKVAENCQACHTAYRVPQ